MFNTDNDKAERKALFELFWDGMSPEQATALLVVSLDELQQVLTSANLLGVDLHTNRPQLALPIRGLNVGAGGQISCFVCLLLSAAVHSRGTHPASQTGRR